MKIRCIILRKDRSIEIVKANPSASHFRWKDGIYTIDKDAVNLTKKDGNANPTPELIYIEGNPQPISIDGTESTQEFLEHTVIENILRATAEPTGFILDIIGDYLKDPSKLLMLVIVLIIAIAGIGGMFGWV